MSVVKLNNYILLFSAVIEQIYIASLQRKTSRGANSQGQITLVTVRMTSSFECLSRFHRSWAADCHIRVELIAQVVFNLSLT